MAKILVVEDAPAVRLVVVEVLTDAGHAVFEAQDGREALGVLEKQAFDLVITDILMPEVDGIEVIKAIRQHYPNTKILAISGGAPHLPAGFALKLSQMFTADAVLYKPFLNDELNASVTALTG
ncbi:MAG TPA: response regulator [Azospirillaceae bacterium]|nr:response regulator [Azospirillaceae bacterium]